MTVILTVVAAVAVVTAVILVSALLKARAEAASARARAEALDGRISQCEAQLRQAVDEKSRLLAANSRLETESSMIRQEMTRTQEQLQDRFNVLASEIMERNSTTFRRQSVEKLNDLLMPFRNELDEFRRIVRDNHERETADLQTLREAVGDLRQSSQAVSQKADDLARVMRGDNRAQGKWGEVVLEHVLEASGLDRDVYTLQATRDSDGRAYRNDGQGALRPDVVIKYPGKRFTVIDSKMSLTAFAEYSRADDETARREAGARHLKSVMQHIDELSRKNYNRYLDSDCEPLDFVIMFIPVEAAYIAALRLDSDLWEKAYAKHVVLVSASQLIPLLRLIERAWNREKITRNTLDIVERGRLMLSKFVLMAESVEKTEAALREVGKQFAQIKSRLFEGDGNLISQARKLERLGLQAQKRLPKSMVSRAEHDSDDADGDGEGV